MRLGLQTPPKDTQSQKSTNFLQNPKLRGIPLYGFLFLSVCFQMVRITSEGADVFTQLCRVANTVTQLNKTQCLLADRSSALACSRHNISALQLISVRSRIVRVVPLFLCCICRTSWTAATVTVQQSAKTPLHISPVPSAYTFIEKKHNFDIWNLKLHAECGKAIIILFFSFFQHFPLGSVELRCLWDELNQWGGCFMSGVRVDPLVNLKPAPSYSGLLSESFSTMREAGLYVILKWFPSHSRHLCKSS